MAGSIELTRQSHDHLANRIGHLIVLLDRRLQRLGVRPNNLTNLLPILEQHERRHGPDAQLLGHVGHLVDVDLVEPGVGVGVAEFDDFGGDNLAWSAPGGEAIEDKESVFVFGQGGVPGLFAVNLG